MLLGRLKLAFAFTTLGYAAVFWLLVLNGLLGDRGVTVTTYGFLPVAAAFMATIVTVALYDALPLYPFSPWRGVSRLISAWTMLPVLIAISWWIRRGAELGAWALLMTGAVMALFYVVRTGTGWLLIAKPSVR